MIVQKYSNISWEIAWLSDTTQDVAYHRRHLIEIIGFVFLVTPMNIMVIFSKSLFRERWKSVWIRFCYLRYAWQMMRMCSGWFGILWICSFKWTINPYVVSALSCLYCFIWMFVYEHSYCCVERSAWQRLRIDQRLYTEYHLNVWWWSWMVSVIHTFYNISITLVREKWFSELNCIDLLEINKIENIDRLLVLNGMISSPILIMGFDLLYLLIFYRMNTCNHSFQVRKI